MRSSQPPPTDNRTRAELSVAAVEPGACTIYGWQNMTIIAWCGQATGASVARLAEVAVHCRTRDPHGHSVVHIVREPTQLPDTQARASLLRMMNENAGGLAAMAVVVGGSGFWATAMRSVVTAMHMVGSRAFELRINGTVEEAAEWIPAVHFKRTGVAIESHELLRVLKEAEQNQLAA